MVSRAAKSRVRLALMACAHCSLCAESCFLYMTKGKKPEYMPSHKMIHSIGTIIKKKGKLTDRQWAEVRDIAWKKCALCMRCYCPLGISIPGLIALARDACRGRHFSPDFAQP